MARALPARWIGLPVATAGLLAAAAALTIGPGSGEWGARTVPLLGAGAMIASGLAIARERGAPVGEARERRDEAKALWLVLIGALCILMMPRIGYLLATALATPPVFMLFGSRSRMTLALATVLVPLALHVFFFRILGVFPPFGRWVDLADYLPV